MDETRVDRWLWAVRAYPTRTSATEACRGGHVKVNRAGAKPATTVRPGDLVEARLPGRERVLEVVRVIERRVGAAVASECYLDRSPPRPERDDAGALAAPARRPAGSGRPTKRDRRRLDELRAGARRREG